MALDGLFKNVADLRNAKGIKFALEPFLCSVLLALLSGATSFRKMEDFINARLINLNQLFDTHWQASPSWVTIRNILLSLDAADMEDAVRKQGEQYSTNNHSSEPLDQKARLGQFLCIDGKALRGSAEKVKDKRVQQILSVFSQHDHLILGHIEVESKSNEIPAVQQLLEMMDLKGATITMDALHCQRKTLEIACEREVEVLVQVKGNQEQLHYACVFTPKFQKPVDQHVSHCKGHGRIEKRTVTTYTADFPTWLKEWQDHIEMTVRVEREIAHKRSGTQEISFETHWWISTAILSAQEFQGAIRGHWLIENKNHYVRDTAFREDACRVREQPCILARMRSMALNCLRNAGKKCISSAIYKNTLDFNNVLALFRTVKA